MVDLIGPQRFYQFEFRSGEKEKTTTVIDLKSVVEISLRESDYTREIMIDIGIHRPPRFINLEDNEVAQEVYQKLVKAWTTYKLATEK